VEGDRKLHGAEASSEVPTHLTDGLDQVLAELCGELVQFSRRQLAQIGRRVDRGDERIRGAGIHAGKFEEGECRASLSADSGSCRPNHDSLMKRA
jgi:hypothetical protein